MWKIVFHHDATSMQFDRGFNKKRCLCSTHFQCKLIQAVSTYNNSLKHSGAQFANTWAEVWKAGKIWKKNNKFEMYIDASSLIQYSMLLLLLAFIENAWEIRSCSTSLWVSHKFWINFIIFEWLVSVMCSHLLVFVFGCVHTNVIKKLECILTVQFAMMTHCAPNTISPEYCEQFFFYSRSQITFITYTINYS